jgi:hypothetical protein
MLLLLPTLALLGLFIAYPFIEGVRLSVTDAKVGVPGQFVGLQNFERIWNDDIFHVAVWNTCVYTAVATVFKLALGLWLALLLNHHFKGKAFTRAFILLPFIIPTVLSTLAWKWMFDPTFSVINWMLFRLGVIHDRINWLGDPNLALISVIIVNRAVLGHSDLCRLPARLRADRRGSGQRHPALRHLRLPARHRHRPPQPRRHDFARRLSGAAARGYRAAALHPPGGDSLSHDQPSSCQGSTGQSPAMTGIELEAKRW